MNQKKEAEKKTDPPVKGTKYGLSRIMNEEIVGSIPKRPSSL